MKLRNLLHSHPESARILPGIFLFALLLAFQMGDSSGNAAGNISHIIRRIAPLGLAAIGLFPVISAGYIDISQFAIMSLSASVTVLLAEASISPILAVSIVLLLGTGIGCISGFVVGKFEVNSILTTYAISLIAKGIMFIITKGHTREFADSRFLAYGRGSLGIFPLPLIIFLLAFSLLIYLMRYSIWGRFVSAVGGNPSVCRHSGIAPWKITLQTFMFSGFFSAVAGITLVSTVGAIAPGLKLSVDLSAIVVVMLGGMQFRGSTHPIGLLFGLMSYALMGNLLLSHGLTGYWQTFIQGIVLLVIIVLAGQFGADRVADSDQTTLEKIL